MYQKHMSCMSYKCAPIVTNPCVRPLPQRFRQLPQPVPATTTSPRLQQRYLPTQLSQTTSACNYHKNREYHYSIRDHHYCAPDYDNNTSVQPTTTTTSVRPTTTTTSPATTTVPANSHIGTCMHTVSPVTLLVTYMRNKRTAIAHNVIRWHSYERQC